MIIGEYILTGLIRLFGIYVTARFITPHHVKDDAYSQFYTGEIPGVKIDATSRRS